MSAEIQPAAIPLRQPQARWRWAVWLGIVAVVLAGIWYLHLDRYLKLVLDRIHSFGPWAPVVFVFVYIVACVLLVPGSVLTLGAGAVFGVAWGSLYVSIGATCGATAAFLVGRYFARDWVAKKIEANPKFAAIDKAVAAEGWKIVLLTRLSPVFPFVFLNYAFGLTRVSLRDYLLASWIGMMPGTVMFVYLGSLARAAGERTRTPAEWALYGVGLLATVGVTVFVTRIARKALAQKISA